MKIIYFLIAILINRIYVIIVVFFCIICNRVINMKARSALITKLCHDLITPFNGISLGLEAYDACKDQSLLDNVRDSVNKANTLLKFFRELYSVKSDSFCSSISALQESISEYLSMFKISFLFRSDIDNIPFVACKVIMYTAIIMKENMPFGGSILCSIDNGSGAILSIGEGKNVTVPSTPSASDINHKNILLYELCCILQDLGFEFDAKIDDGCLIISETMLP